MVTHHHNTLVHWYVKSHNILCTVYKLVHLWCVHMLYIQHIDVVKKWPTKGTLILNFASFVRPTLLLLPDSTCKFSHEQQTFTCISLTNLHHRHTLLVCLQLLFWVMVTFLWPIKLTHQDPVVLSSSCFGDFLFLLAAAHMTMLLKSRRQRCFVRTLPPSLSNYT